MLQDFLLETMWQSESKMPHLYCGLRARPRHIPSAALDVFLVSGTCERVVSTLEAIGCGCERVLKG